MSSQCARCKKNMIGSSDVCISNGTNLAYTSWSLYTWQCGHQGLSCDQCGMDLSKCPECLQNHVSTEKISVNQKKHWSEKENKMNEERDSWKKDLKEKEKNIITAQRFVKKTQKKWLAAQKMFDKREKCLLTESQRRLAANEKTWIEKYKDNVACSQCGQFVHEKQLLSCGCSEDPAKIGGYLGDFLSNSMCGSCALPHILDHGSRIKKAQTIAITLSAEKDSIEFEERMNKMFGREWNCTVDQMTNLKKMVETKMNRESVRKTLESSDSIEDYGGKYKNFDEVLMQIEIKISEITIEVNNYREEIESKLENIPISNDAKNARSRRPAPSTT